MDTDVGELRRFSSVPLVIEPWPPIVEELPYGFLLGDFPKVGIEGEPPPMVTRFMGEALPFLPGLL